MFVGTFATIALEVMGHPFGLATILVAVPVSFLTLIVVSLLTQKRKSGSCLKDYFTDRKEFYSKTDWFRWAAVPMYGSPSGIILSALSLPLSVS